MGIKLIKKESAEPKGHWVVYLRGEEWCTRNTEKEAQAVVNSYDGEGDCWYEFVADETKNEGRVTSYFVLHKNAELKAIDKIVATLEDAILNNQTVETTANPDGTVSIEIYGRMSPDEVARAIQLPGQLSTSYVDLAINIEV